jgi:REP element-mobilizing transposase RayT
VPRPPRDAAPGIHHVGTGATGPSIYFRDDIDYATWTRLLTATVSRYGWTVIIVAALPTHWHGIFEVSDYTLPEGMQYLNGEYSRAFNARHDRAGYLVRDRYWSRRKSTDTELVNGFGYVANNPAYAGIVARAEDWPWSSYATTIGLSDAFGFVDASRVTAQFGPTHASAVVALRQYVTALAERRRLTA